MHFSIAPKWSSEHSELLGAISKPSSLSYQLTILQGFRHLEKYLKPFFILISIVQSKFSSHFKYNYRKRCLLFTNHNLEYKNAAWENVKNSRRKDRNLCSAMTSATLN